MIELSALWFWIVSVMVAIYVVMDGFDFGAGVLHLFVAKTNAERRQVLAAIGPLWDGNEVWLLASGGALFLSFPKVLASGFSGFYLAMCLVVWSLMLRGISIEFRSHVQDLLWRSFWDAAFAAASIALPILLGAALGNVLRGVPLDANGYFEMPRFTSFRTTNPVGILDWYTVLVGVFALVAITAHGALFLAWKSEGPVQDRSAALAAKLWTAVAVLWVIVGIGTDAVNPQVWLALPHRPLGWLFTMMALGGLAFVVYGHAQKRYLLAFLGSGTFLLGLLAATAACVYPVMLRSSLDLALDLTALNSSAAPHGLATGLKWWILGFPVAIGYIVLLFRIHRGKASAAGEGEGY